MNGITGFYNRKNMRLPNFDYSQNSIYFITICTKIRSNVLCEIVGDGFPVPQIRLYESGQITEEYINLIPEKYPNVHVDKYVIMPDHIHLLLVLETGAGNPPPTLGAVIGWFKYQTTKIINLRHKQADKFWQRSYYDHIIRDEQDYMVKWTYIDENPARQKEDIH
jgi:REP element-mobilizing transposase RayT